MTKFPNYKTQSVESLIPYVNNSRTHSPEQVAQIAASIKEFGFTNPVLTDGQNGVVAGHGRLLAAQKLGLTEVPVIELSHLTETQRKAYIIADNKLALNAGWDDEVLRLEMSDLTDAGFDLALTGFGDDEFHALFHDDEWLPGKENSPPEYSGDVNDKYQLLVEYDSENSLNKAFQECKKKGLTCKIIM